MKTVADMARAIGIPPTTARDYVARFQEYFPSKKVAGKRFPMYQDTAQEALQEVVNAYKEGKSTDEVNELLQRTHIPVVEGADNEQERPQARQRVTTTSLSVSPSSSGTELAIRTLAGAYTKLVDFIDTQKQTNQELTLLRQEVGELKQLIKQQNQPQKPPVAIDRGVGSKTPKKGKKQSHTKHKKAVKKEPTPVKKKGFLKKLFGS